MSDHFTANVVDYLAIQAAKMFHATGKPVVGLLTFRLNPAESLASTNLAMTRQQLIRLRDDIDSLISDPESWLHESQLNSEAPTSKE
ncbi:MAG: hypothetical protein R3C49_27395 [Planctomycetaceae bacterium]